MLTRLKVTGFKNLVDVDVRFGPFTCIAGVNGVGKSNLFDAILFLSALSNHPMIEAARSIRGGSGKGGHLRSLFHRVGKEHAREMGFEAEMVVPPSDIDDLGQPAVPACTFLKYKLRIGHRLDDGTRSESLEVIEESLDLIRKTEAPRHLFPHAKEWLDSAVLFDRRRSGVPLISTEGASSERVIKLHQDRREKGNRGGGRARRFLARNLPRTILSESDATGSPTALLARREMQSWRLFQLEPTSLRRPDSFMEPAILAADGGHLPAVLYRLGRREDRNGRESSIPRSSGPNVYASVANRLAELIQDVGDVYVDRDEKRELFTINVRGQDGTEHAAGALSDGTLRFLALSIVAEDPETQGVLCLEEPENGIHPERIQPMLQLLKDIAVDAKEQVGPDNPLRQVIINTHSPAVVQQVPDDSLLVAESQESISERGERFTRVRFRWLEGNWRQGKEGGSVESVCSRSRLLRYLNPVVRHAQADWEDDEGVRRVVDREDLQEFFPFATQSGK
ncbi:MAG: hypothetical protein GHCLOJNM_03895 [bacterium]|nr:hypothetical protein [bacterium]